MQDVEKIDRSSERRRVHYSGRCLAEERESRGFEPTPVCREPAILVLPRGVKKDNRLARQTGGVGFLQRRREWPRQWIYRQLLLGIGGEVEIYQTQAPQSLDRGPRFLHRSCFTGGNQGWLRNRD
jgi:hypothetical protein